VGRRGAKLRALPGALHAQLRFPQKAVARQESQAPSAWPETRHLVIAMFSLIIVYASTLGALNLIHHAIMWRAIINGAVFGCVSVWYFYLKPNVTAFFRELKKR